MPPKKAATPAYNVSLHVGSSFPAAWKNLLLPWFQKVGLMSVATEKPAAVIVPSRSYADFLRRQLLASQVSLLGVRFFTPPQLREFLLRFRDLRLPLREHLRLLLAVTAAEFAPSNEKPSSESAVARSIARNPDSFLRALDQFRAAGFELQRLQPALLAQIATRFEERVHDCGFTFIHEADAILARTNDGSEFSDILVAGFSGAHWPAWPLLSGAVRQSDRATIVFSDPRDEARDLDEAWIGTWEEHFGAHQPIDPPPEESGTFTKLTQPPESTPAVAARNQNPLPHVQFLIGRDSSEQARAIATLAMSFLSESSCVSVAILLPGQGALARLVADALDNAGIRHNDSIAHTMRGTFDDEEWRAWLELQQRQQVGPLLQFLAHSPAAAGFFPNLSSREMERAVRRACSDILINDVGVVAEYCRRRTNDQNFPLVAKGLSEIQLLPEQATLSKFLQSTQSIFRALEWRERAGRLEQLTRGWTSALTSNFSRADFLRWLTELFAETALCRDQYGEHPYARVQLLRYDQAENQTWSHLILGGLNEGAWPKHDDESPFLGDEQIATLNAQQRELNRRATKEGRFGAGQTIVREGATLCLGARERRDLALRQLWNAIESATGEIAITAQLYNTSPREQAVNPSEFFTQLYFNARGVALSQREIEKIHRCTTEWLTRANQDRVITPPADDVAQTSTAYLARRRAEQPFGEYEFAFRKGLPPSRQISLSATEAARLFTAPALVWMKRFLGVESDERDVVSWNLATGNWVHRWLATVAPAPDDGDFVSKSSKIEIVASVDRAANDFQNEINSILDANARALPDWWVSGWRNARYLAGRFAEELGDLAGWPQIATELRLASEQIVPLDDQHQLRVRGRIDLLLARGNDPDSRELWIVDYKTGVAPALKPQRSALRKQLNDGNGVQICIYALALRQPKWRDIYASLLTRETDLEAPQLRLDDIEAHDSIWKEIARMQANGIFGMVGEIRSAFTFTGVYPLATLAIDKDFLRDKWRRTHPAFAGIESDE